MLRSMSSSQYTEWIAFYQAYPPEAEDDHRFGVIAALVANVASGGKGQRKLKPTDFFPSRVPQPEKKTSDELLKKVIAANTHLGGTDKRR